jgi:hypothetical protein
MVLVETRGFYTARSEKPRRERRYKTDAEILTRLNSELQAIVDATIEKIKRLAKIEEARKA